MLTDCSPFLTQDENKMPDFKTIDPKEISLGQLHHTLLSLITPRPIAFASTVSAKGEVNLSPFSYFNVFGINPPTLIFSPARSVRTLQQKHTLLNVQEVGECVVNLVDYDIVEQASLASCEYPEGVNEFGKAGLTMLPSERVKPPRAAEAPASFECRVQQIIETGPGGGAGMLIICEVVKIHVRADLLTEEGRVDLQKIRPVGRMGGNYYVKAFGEALFEVTKPNEKVGIGIDALPKWVRESQHLTGAMLARLGNVERIPTAEPDLQQKLETYIGNEWGRGSKNANEGDTFNTELLSHLLAANEVSLAWQYIINR